LILTPAEPDPAVMPAVPTPSLTMLIALAMVTVP